jgi:hypothetical protein
VIGRQRRGEFGLELALSSSSQASSDLLGHWRSNAGAGLAVFDHHRHRNLRVVGRGEGDEQGVIAMPLVELGTVVFFTLA